MQKAGILVLLLLSLFQHTNLLAQEKLIIAHRGASGYLPEHTIQAKALAHAMGADYIEQDIVMTRDGALIVHHDLTLDRTTNVASVFPARMRSDGHYYVIDFTLSEIRQLSITQDFDRDRARELMQRYQPDYPAATLSDFRIHTLAEELELIQELNASSGRNVGIYPEIKSPWFHHLEGKDLSLAVLDTLRDFDYRDRNDRVYLQSFDFNELVRIRNELMPQLDMDLKLVQLIAENNWQETFEQNAKGESVPYDYEWMYSRTGIDRLAQYVDGIGPNLFMIIRPESSASIIIDTTLVTLAHQAGLQVHAYTFRTEPSSLPPYARNFQHLLQLFLIREGIDGIFTDNPDQARLFWQNALLSGDQPAE